MSADFDKRLDSHIARLDAILLTLDEILAALKTTELSLFAAQVGHAEHESMVLRAERVVKVTVQ